MGRVVHNVWRAPNGDPACLVRSHVRYDTEEAIPSQLHIVRDICGGADPCEIGDEGLGVPDMWRMGMDPLITKAETEGEKDDVSFVASHCEVLWVALRLAMTIHPEKEGKVTAQVYGLGPFHPDVVGTYAFCAPSPEDGSRALDDELHGADDDDDVDVSTRMTPAKEAFAGVIGPILNFCLDPRLILQAWEAHDRALHADSQRHGGGSDAALVLDEPV